MAEQVDVTEVDRTEEFFNNFMDKDNLSRDWVLFNSTIPVSIILLVYILVVAIGPRYMETRPPLQMKTTLRIYNIVQVICNGYLASQVLFDRHAILCMIEMTCSLEREAHYANLRPTYLLASWMYLLLKIFDLLDTVFMVLRKKNTHITFLHVYHHSAMVFFVWLNLKYTKPLHGAIACLINMTLHTVMYSYYFLTTFSRLKKFIFRWKKNVTKLQMAQFMFILLYVPLLYIYGCPISRVFTFTCTFNMLVFIVLFVNFYIKAYMVKSFT